jgi:hypothetical protein
MLKGLLPLMMLGVAGCSASNNFPMSHNFPAPAERPAAVRLFVDANGSFYPDRWQEKILPARLAKAKSLLNASVGNPALENWLSEQEAARLNEVAAAASRSRRIFILIHGYNIDEALSAFNFDLVERRIDFAPDDLLIRFHWDGLLGGSYPASGKVWFNATGYSQLAGVRGLRRVLDRFSGKEVFLISHSRGASVILSALGNPPYDPGFRRQTEALDFARDPAFLQPPELADRGNHIRAIFLGPAIGFPDFWDARCEPRPGQRARCADPPASAPCPEYRRLSSQLLSIRYTLNDGDDTLNKFVGLGRYFNATDLGRRAEVGASLKPCYGFPLVEQRIAKTHPHDFVLYAQDPELADMLRASGVKPRY